TCCSALDSRAALALPSPESSYSTRCPIPRVQTRRRWTRWRLCWPRPPRGREDRMRKSEHGKVWIHFRRENKRYVTPEGTEVTVAELMEHPHALRDVVRDSGELNGMEYDELGVQVNRAIEKAEAALLAGAEMDLGYD